VEFSLEFPMRSYAHSVAWSLRSAILEGNEYSATRRVLSPGALEHVASPGAPCITHYIHSYVHIEKGANRPTSRAWAGLQMHCRVHAGLSNQT